MERVTMKNIPKEERPYERCLRLGPKSLSDAELLSIIIRTGTKEANSLELAQKILALNYPKEGILGLLHHSLPELMKVKGIGMVKAAQLVCIGELSKRIWKAAVSSQGPLSFHDPRDIADYYMEDLRHEEQEQIIAMLFNTKQVLIRDCLLSKGTVNASVISPREIFIEALRHGAVSIVLVHNHPSGDSTPSRQDVLLTKRVKEAGDMIGIALLDHIVIGDNEYISFRERGLI